MKTAYFLDFDGVICDSVIECFVVSWIAYQRHVRSEKRTSIPISFFNAFRTYRPFIRTGEDYIVIHDIMEKGLRLRNQKDFDTQITDTGKSRMKAFRGWFYGVRSELLENEPERWFSLNPLFAGIRPVMEHLSSINEAWIVSTKKELFIKKVLDFNNIDWPVERIQTIGSDKHIFISEKMDQHGASKGYYIEDQIDHLRKVSDIRIVLLLAEWGYIKKDWKISEEINAVSMREFRQLVTGLP